MVLAIKCNANEPFAFYVISLLLLVFKNGSILRVYNIHTSSMANKRPPTGAPKAEAMPAAAPAEMKFRRSSELRKREKHGRLHSKVADLN